LRTQRQVGAAGILISSAPEVGDWLQVEEVSLGLCRCALSHFPLPLDAAAGSSRLALTTLTDPPWQRRQRAAFREGTGVPSRGRRDRAGFYTRAGCWGARHGSCGWGGARSRQPRDERSACPLHPSTIVLIRRLRLTCGGSSRLRCAPSPAPLRVQPALPGCPDAPEPHRVRHDFERPGRGAPHRLGRPALP
jgi:hypothetical protein